MSVGVNYRRLRPRFWTGYRLPGNCRLWLKKYHISIQSFYFGYWIFKLFLLKIGRRFLLARDFLNFRSRFLFPFKGSSTLPFFAARVRRFFQSLNNFHLLTGSDGLTLAHLLLYDLSDLIRDVLLCSVLLLIRVKHLPDISIESPAWYLFIGNALRLLIIIDDPSVSVLDLQLLKESLYTLLCEIHVVHRSIHFNDMGGGLHLMLTPATLGRQHFRAGTYSGRH